MWNRLASVTLVICACSPAPPPEAPTTQGGSPPYPSTSASTGVREEGDTSCRTAAEALELTTLTLADATQAQRAKTCERIEPIVDRWSRESSAVTDTAVRAQGDAYVSALAKYAKTIGIFTFVDPEAPTKVLLPESAVAAREESMNRAHNFLTMMDAGALDVPSHRAAVTDARAELRRLCPE
jgi:hypothetical protein